MVVKTDPFRHPAALRRNVKTPGSCKLRRVVVFFDTVFFIVHLRFFHTIRQQASFFWMEAFELVTNNAQET